MRGGRGWCLAIVLVLVGFAEDAKAAPAEPPTVILISLDGTRPDDVTPETMPHLSGLTESGVSVDGLESVFPSNTFPAHVSLATGVTPQRHGLVNNGFEDSTGSVFEKKDPNIPRWIEVEPIWSILEGAGLPTASFHWVGSEGPWPPTGRGPSDWKPFDFKISESQKVDQILEWIDRPPESRPRLITAWFHGADGPGHRAGPGSASARRSLQKQDKQILRLLQELEKRDPGLVLTTVIFVSDHGMASATQTVNLSGVLGRDSKRGANDGVSTRIYGIGGFASVVLAGKDAGNPQAAERVVERARREGLEAYPRAAAPEDWRVDHPRFGDVVVRAPMGTAIVRPFLWIKGFHGYAPSDAEMQAIFYAVGRGVKPGVRLGEARAIDVAPTVLDLLDQPIPDWMEGRALNLQGTPSDL